LFSLCIDALGKGALYVYIVAIWMTALLFLWMKRLGEYANQAAAGVASPDGESSRT